VVLYLGRTVHKLELGLLKAKLLTRDDQSEKGHAVMETHVFDTICTFSPDCGDDCFGTLTTLCEGQLHSLE
jgi:hypothetical protein